MNAFGRIVCSRSWGFGVFSMVFLASAVGLVHAAGDPARISTGEIFDEAKAAATLPGVRRPLTAYAPTREVSLPPIAAEELGVLKQGSAGQEYSKAQRVGVPRELAKAGTPLTGNKLQWAAAADGGSIARFAVTSPDAKSLRIALAVRAAPQGTELRFFGKGDTQPVGGAVEGAAVAAQPQYWSPVVQGDAILVEIYLPPAASAEQLELGLSGVSHILRDPVSGEWQKNLADLDQSGACLRVNDLTCESPANQATIAVPASATAKYLVTSSNGITTQCTGILLSDLDASTRIPYMLTAAHCLDNGPQELRTMNSYWFFEKTSCNGTQVRSFVQLTGGARFQSLNTDTDHALLRLNENPPQGAGLAGFDANPVTPGLTFITLHHPFGDVKKVSVGGTLDFSSFLGRGSFITVQWDDGITEFGSSGAGGMTLGTDGTLFVRGGLQGGASSCAAPAGLDKYSRLDLAWPEIQPFLNPAVTPQNVALAVDFYLPQFGHYFTTAFPAEAVSLDAGGGWLRTGETFKAFKNPGPGLVEVCRFFSGQAFSPKSSHFYTPFADECAFVKRSTVWQYEGVAYYVALPASDGSCTSATTEPLYRLYNNGQTGAPNHRYTRNLSTRASMIAQGWVPEGAGPLGVIACVPK